MRALYLLIFLVISCGQIADNKVKGEQEKSQLVVLIGGFDSCKVHSSVFTSAKPEKLEMYAENFGPLRDHAAENGIELNTIILCMYLGDSFEFLDVQTGVRVSGEFVDEAQKLSRYINENRQDRPVHLVGHSYGGWAAMQTLQNLQSSVKNLITIDPISPADCTVVDIAESFYNSLGATNAHPHPGCTHAPNEYQNALMRNDILARTGNWNNYYQLYYDYLHSSSMEGANNRGLHFSTYPYLEYQAHKNIGSDERIWSEVRDLIVR